MAVLSLVAIALGIHLSWTRRGLPAPDLPAAVLSSAVLALPATHRPWGEAMKAELAEIRGSAQRWSFALGCARAALLAPRPASPPWAAPAVIATAGTVGLAAHVLVPAGQVFAMTLTALAGRYLTTLTAERRRIRHGTVICVTMIAALVGCLVVVYEVTVTYPVALRDPSHLYAVLLASLLTGYLYMAITPPAFTTRFRDTRWLALGAAIASAVAWITVSFVARRHGPDLSRELWPATAAIIFVACTVAVAINRRRRAAAETGLWAGMIVALLHFAVGIPAVLTAGQRAVHGRSVALTPGLISDEVGAGIALLILVPVTGVLLGIIGGSLGSRLSR